MAKKFTANLIPSINFAQDIGIDLGTANTLVFAKEKGIVVQEPSVVAIQIRTGTILAVGNEAKEMIGRTPSNIIAIRPLKDGVIADFETTKSMLKYFIKKALKGKTLLKPRVLISVPLGITQVERRAVVEAAKQAGAKEAYTIEEPVAAAIGVGLPVSEPIGSMIIDIGGGTTEIAILSLGGVVIGKSLRVGGDEINEAIIKYLKKEYSLDIGERTAEKIKISIGFAADPDPNLRYQVIGRNLATGMPVKIDINAPEISRAIAEPVNAILEAITATLEQTPPELAADVMDRGILLAGGGALLRNLDLIISRVTSIPVTVAEDPLTCVVRGTGYAVQDLDYLKRIAT